LLGRARVYSQERSAARRQVTSSEEGIPSESRVKGGRQSATFGANAHFVAERWWLHGRDGA
jgi:hypothetical protein